MEKLDLDGFTWEKRTVYGWHCRKCNYRFLAQKQLKHHKGIRISQMLIEANATEKPSCPNCRKKDDVIQSDEVKADYVNQQKQKELAQRKRNNKLIILSIVLMVLLFILNIIYS